MEKHNAKINKNDKYVEKVQFYPYFKALFQNFSFMRSKVKNLTAIVTASKRNQSIHHCLGDVANTTSGFINIIVRWLE